MAVVAQVVGFSTQVVALLAEVMPFTLACALALLIRSKLHAVLVVVNLCLLMELTASLTEPGYRFGDLVATRLVATTLEVAIAYWAITWWRSRRIESRSVSAR